MLRKADLAAQMQRLGQKRQVSCVVQERLNLQPDETRAGGVHIANCAADLVELAVQARETFLERHELPHVRVTTGAPAFTAGLSVRFAVVGFDATFVELSVQFVYPSLHRHDAAVGSLAAIYKRVNLVV